MGSGPGGGTHGMDYILVCFSQDHLTMQDFDNIGVVSYFGDLFNEMNKIGYVPNRNLFGASFDWRVSPG